MATSALFDATSFPAVGQYDWLVPRIGLADTAYWPPNFNDPVQITLSDNTVVTVFDTVMTAMRCLENCRRRGQSFVAASDDVIVVTIDWHKLLICEATLTLQKLLASYHIGYTSGRVLCWHRTLSSVETLAEALQSVGFALNSTGGLDNNRDLGSARLHAVLVDYRYKGVTTPVDVGSRLIDGPDNIISYNWDTVVLGRAPPALVPPPAAPPSDPPTGTGGGE